MRSWCGAARATPTRSTSKTASTAADNPFASTFRPAVVSSAGFPDKLVTLFRHTNHEDAKTLPEAAQREDEEEAIEDRHPAKRRARPHGRADRSRQEPRVKGLGRDRKFGAHPWIQLGSSLRDGGGLAVRRSAS